MWWSHRRRSFQDLYVEQFREDIDMVTQQTAARKLPRRNLLRHHLKGAGAMLTCCQNATATPSRKAVWLSGECEREVW